AEKFGLVPRPWVERVDGMSGARRSIRMSDASIRTPNPGGYSRAGRWRRVEPTAPRAAALPPQSNPGGGLGGGRRGPLREKLASSRGVRAKERPRRAGRLRLRVVARPALPCQSRPIPIAQVQVAQADLHEGFGHLHVTELEDLLKFDQRLAVVVLHVVR